MTKTPPPQTEQHRHEHIRKWTGAENRWVCDCGDILPIKRRPKQVKITPAVQALLTASNIELLERLASHQRMVSFGSGNKSERYVSVETIEAELTKLRGQG